MSNDISLVKLALKKVSNKIKWNVAKQNKIAGMLRGEIKDARRYISSGKIRMAVNSIVGVFEMADENDAFDKRCNYPGCGNEIKFLVMKYM